MMKEQLYSIGEAAKMTGISARQLRNWEVSGYISSSIRVVCGLKAYRFYNDSHIDLLNRIKEGLDTGFTLKKASEEALKITEKGD